jgi:hypothetical protein
MVLNKGAKRLLNKGTKRIMNKGTKRLHLHDIQILELQTQKSAICIFLKGYLFLHVN